MPETAKIYCFNCGEKANHWYSPIIFGNCEGFFTCVRPED